MNHAPQEDPRVERIARILMKGNPDLPRADAVAIALRMLAAGRDYVRPEHRQ